MAQAASGEFTINPFDPAFVADPFPVYERGRREAPVHRHAGLPLLSVFRFADQLPVLKDPELWSSRSEQGGRPGRDPDEDASMLGSDPPRHTRLRGLVNQAFTPRRVRELEPRIRDLARDAVARLVEQGEGDVVAALSIPLPVTIIAEMIGVPTDDLDRFKAWSDAVASNLGSGLAGAAEDPAELAQRERAGDEMDAYFAALAAERRRDPRDDLLTGLVRAEHEGDRLSTQEMLAMLTLLLVAGNETTTNLISNAVLQLDAHRDAQAELHAEPGLVPMALEEVLRFDGPVQTTLRTATRDTEIADEKVAAGEAALLWLGSANRDEAEFPGGERFELRRDPKRHLAFGFGVHFCLGANLARLEARIALEELLAQTTSFERTDAAPLPRNPSFILRGPRALPLALRPR